MLYVGLTSPAQNGSNLHVFCLATMGSLIGPKMGNIIMCLSQEHNGSIPNRESNQCVVMHISSTTHDGSNNMGSLQPLETNGGMKAESQR